jgi:DNA primase
MKIDFESVKNGIDLLAYCQQYTELKKVASSGGGEYAGACPVCGGRDRFHVQPVMKRWLCHYCTNSVWKDVINLEKELKQCDTVTSVVNLVGTGGLQPGAHIRQPDRRQVYAPPTTEWQTKANQIIQFCELELWKEAGAKAKQWLNKRGITDASIKRWRLGWSEGGNIFGAYLEHGITIPCMVGDMIWYLKVRTNGSVPGRKYVYLKDSKPKAIYGAKIMSDQVLLVEGEFDCILANQEIGDVIPAITFGAATYIPDMEVWQKYFDGVTVLLAYDKDKAGEGGADMVVKALGECVKLAPLPEGKWKDVTDFYQAGGDLWAWIKQYLDFYDAMPSSISEWAASVGANLTGETK